MTDLPAAILARRTADALNALFLGLVDIRSRAADDGGNDQKHNQIGHIHDSFRQDPLIGLLLSVRISREFNQRAAFAAALRAFSAASLASFFLIRLTITAAIAITTIRPGTKPAPTEPVVISVPIW